MSRKGLLDHRRARTGKADDKDRMPNVGTRTSAREDFQARRGEEPMKPLDQILRLPGQIVLAAHFAQRALACVEGGERFRVAAHLVEQLAFLGPFGRSEAALPVPALDLIED